MDVEAAASKAIEGLKDEVGGLGRTAGFGGRRTDKVCRPGQVGRGEVKKVLKADGIGGAGG